jgi:hypothetical protein
MTSGQTIQQIKDDVAGAAIESGQPETLWHFLEQLPSSLEAQQFYGLLIAGTLGIIAHYVMKYLYGEVLFRKRFKRVLASWLMFVGSCAGLVAAGVFTTDSDGFTGWFSVLIQGFTAGLGIDAIANKSSKEVWSEEKRAEITGKFKTPIVPAEVKTNG